MPAKWWRLLARQDQGKARLLHLLGGLDNADPGSIQVNGKEITRLSEKNAANFVISIWGSFINFIICCQSSPS